MSELCLVGKAAILVPSPYVAEDHQTHNAMALKQMGAAVLISDKDAPEQAFEEAIRLLDHEAERKKLETEIRKLARPDAAEEIAEIIIASARKKEEG